MHKLIIPFILSILSVSCALNGSGQHIVTGTLSGNVPATAKVALFALVSPDQYSYLYDIYNDVDKDIVFTDLSGDESGTLTPIAGLVVTPAADGTYSITFPTDTSTAGYLIAWNDLNNNSIIDLPAEAAYIPVKTIGGKNYAVHHFTSIDALNITYIAVYSTMDLSDPDYNLQLYSPHQDSFDAIGADGYNFNFR